MDWFTDDVKNSASKKTKTVWSRLSPRKTDREGYIDFVSNEVCETLKSCARDAIINIARLFNVDIKDDIHTIVNYSHVKLVLVGPGGYNRPLVLWVRHVSAIIFGS